MQKSISLAKRIKSSRGWVTRALRGDVPARFIRLRIAAALSRKDAIALGLGMAWEVVVATRKLRRDMEVVATTEPPTKKRYVLTGIGKWVDRSVA